MATIFSLHLRPCSSAFPSSSSPSLCCSRHHLPPIGSHPSSQLLRLCHPPGGGSLSHGLQLLVSLRQKQVCRALVDTGKASASGNKEELDFPPPGCTRIKVELNKPLGIVLEEDKSGNIFVAELVKDGNADKCGLVEVGDQLIATSAIVYADEEDYQGVKVRKGMQIVRLGVRGEKFDTVMAAIGTHPAYVKVTLEFQKCKPVTNGANNGSVRI